MADVIISPNMQLPIPIVGLEFGPQYATDINNCLTLTDQHDHTPGYGVQITTAALNIDADLNLNYFNLALVRTVQFDPEPNILPGVYPDIGCLYVVQDDLYYNDYAGNPIRLTQGGSIVGTAGSITGLVVPASASYGSNTFVWQSDSLTPANMDAASYIFRNLAASSFGLTLNPPAAMSFDYSLTLPAIPVSTRVLSVNTGGAIVAGVANAIVTADIADAQITTIKIADDAVTTAKIPGSAIITNRIADNAVTQAKKAIRLTNNSITPGAFQASTSSGSFYTNSAIPVTVTNQSVVITTLGNPVSLQVNSASLAPASLGGSFRTGSATGACIYILRDGVIKASHYYTGSVPCSSIKFIDYALAAGTYNYTLQVSGFGFLGADTTVSDVSLTAYEL